MTRLAFAFAFPALVIACSPGPEPQRPATDSKSIVTAPDDPKPPQAEAGTDERVACGENTCAPGLVCCNASCGICTPPDGACIQRACEPKAAPNACVRAGCSGTVCTEDAGFATTCEWKEEYACYQAAICERQADGKCGFRATDELKRCLAETPKK